MSEKYIGLTNSLGDSRDAQRGRVDDAPHDLQKDEKESNVQIQM